MEINTWFLILQLKIMSYLKNTMMFGMLACLECWMFGNGGKKNYYEKDYMKIKFNSDDDLPSNKSLKFHNMTITIKSVFKQDGKLYPQVHLDDTSYELKT